MLADMGAHGALVTGTPIAFDPALLDSTKLSARQWFGDQEVANSTGGNPAIDIGRVLTWLANHCAARGLGLTKGQIVTTGSCTGMLFAPAGAQARGLVAELGECAVTFTS